MAMATSMTLNINTELADASTKDDVVSGVAWAVQDVTGMSWDATCDSLVTLTDNGSGSTGELPADLVTAQLANTKLNLVFDTTSGTNNRTADSSAIKMSGQAYIASLSITAQNRANSTITVNFTGTGALTMG